MKFLRLTFRFGDHRRSGLGQLRAKKLQKAFIEDFKEASEEAAELLGQQKAADLMEDYKDEKSKRGIFTYTAGIIVVKQKAETSLNNARRFYSETSKLIR